MKSKLFLVAQLAVIGLFLSLPDRAAAQSKNITVDASAVVVWGARLAFVDDGGCTVQPECSIGSYGDAGFVRSPVFCESRARPIRAALCTAARDAVMRAATLDVGVSDGGQP